MNRRIGFLPQVSLRLRFAASSSFTLAAEG
jgi:hypothetical protein